MREVSGHGIRGLLYRGCSLALLAIALLLGGREASAQAITRYSRDTGNINFVTTGGSLRNSPNTGTPCTLNSTSTQTLSGIPAGRTVRAAYLYWGGSWTGSGSFDTSVTLNGVNVSATRTFSRTFDNGTNFPFFGGFAVVTNMVSGNGSYTFGGLTVHAGNPHCGSQAVVGGWALVVIYEGAGERLRAINIFDGLDYFYGSQVTLTPDGFRVPASNIDGRVAVFTLEGDPQNSDSSGGFSEALRFNGTLLDDNLIPAGSVPPTQQFDGTISTQGVVTSYGIDVDQYEVGSMLGPGQTSATTVYSAGADLVLLMAQIVSATSDPAVNLSAAVSHTGNFVAGTTGTYTVVVSNASGFEREDNTVTVTDVLPAGLTYNSFTGTGWNCTNAGQTVTCTHAPTINAGSSLPPLNIVVNVSGPAVPGVTNTVTVSTPSFDFDTSDNTASDVTVVLGPNLSTSTKTVLDVNGGEANPGDTLRYTVTITESAGQPAVNVTLTDSVPANTSWGGFVSVPGGATSSFAPGAGANGNGEFTVSGISIPANGSVTVVFDVTVDNVSPNSTIDNTATVGNPNGSGATPSAPTVLVSPSQEAQEGTKQLYLWSNSQRLSRTRPTNTHNTLTINGNNDSETFALNPPLRSDLTLNGPSFPVHLRLQRAGSTTGSGGSNRTVTVTLTNSVTGTIGSVSRTFNNMSTTMQLYTFTVPTAGVTVPQGSTFSLVVSNNSNNTSNRQVNLQPYSGSSYSHVELDSATVINVDSVLTYNLPFGGGVVTGTYAPGATVYVRAVVSDPFGGFDINGANISISNPSGTVVLPSTAMPVVQGGSGSPAACSSTSSALCTFEYAFTLPANAPEGGWTVNVTAREGVENLVSDLGVGSFVVAIPRPSLTILKISRVISDPVSSTNPKRIPQAVVEYEIQATNSGPGPVDANTLEITDSIPADAVMYVGTSLGDPVAFANGATPSGLTYNYPAHVTYSTVGPAGPWNHTASPDANGYDPLIRGVRIRPAGAMNGAAGGNPSFTIRFRVRIN